MKREMRHLIVDCDPGVGVPGRNVDDGLALALAAGLPDAWLEQVTIVSGNTPAPLGFASARTLLEDWGIDVPVAMSGTEPLSETALYHRDRLDRPGLDPAVQRAWAGVPEPRNYVADRRTAATAIIEAVEGAPGRIDLIATGPLTNIAAAVQAVPGLPDKLRSLTIMGGALSVPGYRVETNFSYDPDSAAAVLSCGAPITLVSMDATTRTMLTAGDLDCLEEIDSGMARSLIPAVRPWVDYSASTRGIRGCWIHDAAAVAVVLRPEIATYSDVSVEIALQGPDRGKTTFASSGPIVRIVETIDNSALLGLLRDALLGARRRERTSA
ncbi:nucleoside hydrolase [Arthrobacter sp. NPDC090010]|uniref:nucleoside hydrolase n=1 Tax=Arthrobacter sp. NPDC090010 TaxID=3363942 RepID=UPI00383019D8